MRREKKTNKTNIRICNVISRSVEKKKEFRRGSRLQKKILDATNAKVLWKGNCYNFRCRKRVLLKRTPEFQDEEDKNKVSNGQIQSNKDEK
jgi:hypothetical protein